MTVFEKAIIFAVRAHQGMRRKSQEVPYIAHPLEVAEICSTMTSDPEVLAAAVLHDTVEDTDVTLEDIRRRFGERVAMLVSSETEDKHPELPKSDSWRMRKEESLKELANATDPGVKILWLSDKLSNIRSFYRAWRIQGNAFWNQFNQKDPAQQAWYYRSIAELLRELEAHEAWQEFNSDVEAIFKGV